MNIKKSLILIFILAFVGYVSASANVAYVIRSTASPLGDTKITGALNQVGLTYEIILDNGISSLTDFSGYDLILIQGNIRNSNYLPLQSKSAIFVVDSTANSALNIVWPTAGIGALSSMTGPITLDLSSPIAQGFTKNSFFMYTLSQSSFKIYTYRENLNEDAVYNGDPLIASSEDGSVRDVFFGISNTAYWTDDSNTLFKNSLNWLKQGLCTDYDGDYYIIGNVDKNSCGNVCGLNADEACAGNNDCDDSDETVNPGSSNIFKNCINDAPVIISVDVPDVYEEDLITVTIEAIDPEEDAISYSINDSRFVQDEVNKNVFTWQTDTGDAGNYEFETSVTDGKLTEPATKFLVVVNPKNNPPVCNNIGNLSWNEGETKTFNINEYCSDAEGTGLLVEVDDSSDNVYADINGLMISLYSDENFNGDEWIILKVSDGRDDVLTNRINLKINPINDAPVFSGEIEDITLNENTNLTNVLNLGDYFSDVDSNLNYSVSGNSLINIKIENLLVSIFPKAKWFGSETLVFSASDGQSSVNSNSVKVNVIENNHAPVFDDFNCEMNILEDNSYTCEINANDIENDDIVYSVISMNYMNCSFSGNVLTYSSVKDYHGPGSCKLRASDGRLYSDAMFTVDVNNVNDAPVITDYFPKDVTRIMSNVNQVFRVIANDIDSAMTISWYVNDVFEGNGNSFTFNRDTGDYNVNAIVNDEEFSVNKAWTVSARPVSEFTCSEAGGYICGSSEICIGNILGVRDSTACCSVRCSEKPPQFSDINKCVNKNSNIVVNILEPDANDEFKIGNKTEVNLEITNLADSSKSYYAEAYVYDLTDDNSVDKFKESVSINNGTKNVNITINFPEELDEKDKYAVYVKVYEKSDIESCNDNYVKIIVSRNSYDFRINEVNVIPKVIYCSDEVTASVDLENTGKYDMTGNFRIEIPSLKIDVSSDNFYLESNDEKTESLSFFIPENAKSDSYKMRVTGNFGGINKSIESEIIVEGCENEVIDTSSIETIKLNGNNLAVENKTSEKTSWKILLIIEGLVVAFVLIVVFIVIIIGKDNFESFGEKNLESFSVKDFRKQKHEAAHSGKGRMSKKNVKKGRR